MRAGTVLEVAMPWWAAKIVHAARQNGETDPDRRLEAAVHGGLCMAEDGPVDA